MNDILDIEAQNYSTDKLFTKIYNEHKYGLWLNGRVGCGKTYIVAKTISKLVENNFFADSKGIFPVLWITKASAIEQTNRVLLDQFKLPPNLVYCTNYDQFRASFGEIWVKEKTVVKFGQPEIDYVWNEAFAPKLFILDESQSLKNETSQQAQIFIAAGKLPEAYFIHVSASPFDRVAGAKAFVIHSRVPYSYGFNTNCPMCEEHWLDFAKYISGRTNPYEYNKAACKRLRDYMEEYIVTVPKIKTKFRETNSVQCVPISPEKKSIYLLALIEYIDAVKRILDEEPPNGAMLMLVAFLMFRKKAEILKVDELAEAAMASIKAGKAPIIGCNFKVTLAKISELLVNKYGLSRDDISLIWGGISKPIKGKATASAILDYDSVEQAVNDLDLGPQNREARQKEIDKFQDGKSKVCLFTFKAGGVALSLHHHKEGQLPREGYFATTYSAIELLQALGRDHRVNSISDTLNTIILFEGTIEQEHVYPILVNKVRCIGEIVGTKEKWADITLAGETYIQQKAKDILGNVEEEDETEDGYLGDYEDKLLTNGDSNGTGQSTTEDKIKPIEQKAVIVYDSGQALVSPPMGPNGDKSSGRSDTIPESTNPEDISGEQILLPIPVSRTFQCNTINYIPLWHKLPNKRPCSIKAVDSLCQRYGADKPKDSSMMTFIEKSNGKRCLIRMDRNNNYTVAYED